MARFEGKVALVTGAAQGIGLAIAEEIAAHGATVYGADVNMARMEESAAALAARGLKVHALALNVADRASCDKAVADIVAKEGHLDLLVNNAGVTRDGLLMRMKPEDWDLVLNVNLTGAFSLTQCAVNVMVKQRFGRIVNVASVVGQMGNPGQANYVASKAGLIGFTKVVAKELAGRNITCNAVAPGFIATAMTEKLDDRQRETMLSIVPLKREGTPKDIAQAVSFLLSEEASYITGQVLSVNGGMYM